MALHTGQLLAVRATAGSGGRRGRLGHGLGREGVSPAGGGGSQRVPPAPGDGVAGAPLEFGPGVARGRARLAGQQLCPPLAEPAPGEPPPMVSSLAAWRPVAAGGTHIRQLHQLAAGRTPGGCALDGVASPLSPTAARGVGSPTAAAPLLPLAAEPGLALRLGLLPPLETPGTHGRRRWLSGASPTAPGGSLLAQMFPRQCGSGMG